jgi:hypothetical protein
MPHYRPDDEWLNRFQRQRAATAPTEAPITGARGNAYAIRRERCRQQQIRSHRRALSK